VKGFIPLLLIVLAAAPAARAAQPGDDVMQVGWLHIIANSSSTPLHTDLRPSLLGSLLGVQSSFDSPGTAATVHNADTPALIFTHFVSHHIALQFVGGVPAEIDISGSGKIAPTGILGNFLDVNLGAPASNPLVSVHEWTPVLLAQYYFRPNSARLHPYVGLGLTYAWFSDLHLNGAFQQDIKSNFGSILAFSTGHSGPTTVGAAASRSWNPVYNAGLEYDLSRHWGLAASVSYSPLASTATINLNAQDGTLLANSKTRLSQNSLVTAVLVNYRFRLFPLRAAASP
jgi:outer membrane protein